MICYWHEDLKIINVNLNNENKLSFSSLVKLQCGYEAKYPCKYRYTCMT